MIRSNIVALYIIGGTAFVLSVVGVVLASLALGTRSFDYVETKRLVVKPPQGASEGVLVSFDDSNGENAYANDAAGVRVNMPKQTAVGSSAQAGLLVEGGQTAYASVGTMEKGVDVRDPNPALIAFNTNVIPNSQVLHNSGVNVLG